MTNRERRARAKMALTMTPEMIKKFHADPVYQNEMIDKHIYLNKLKYDKWIIMSLGLLILLMIVI